MTGQNIFSLFQSLLDEFPERLAEAALLDPVGKEFDLNINLAIVAFSQSKTTGEWSNKQHQIIRDRLNGDLADLDWFEDCAEAIRLFVCLCLGALLEGLAAGKIDDADFLLADAHLAGFNMLNEGVICKKWQLSAKLVSRG